MKGFVKTSIGKKLLMSVSGLFLITFLLVHLTANLCLFLGKEAFNSAVEFMDTNPLIQIMQPILALGFLVHIIYSMIITIQNKKARGENQYATVNQTNSSTWASRNMLPLGTFVFAFLIIHLIDFFLPMKTSEITDPYTLVTERFKLWYIVACYVVGTIALGIHLHHAFWSALQTMGLSNDVWKKRLGIIGDFFAVIIAAGFSSIALYFFLF